MWCFDMGNLRVYYLVRITCPCIVEIRMCCHSSVSARNLYIVYWTVSMVSLKLLKYILNVWSYSWKKLSLDSSQRRYYLSNCNRIWTTCDVWCDKRRFKYLTTLCYNLYLELNKSFFISIYNNFITLFRIWAWRIESYCSRSWSHNDNFYWLDWTIWWCYNERFKTINVWCHISNMKRKILNKVRWCLDIYPNITASNI
jgi:hypothetical protein